MRGMLHLRAATITGRMKDRALALADQESS